MRRAALFVIAGVFLFGMQYAGAATGTAGPATVTVTPTAGVVDGDAVAIHASVPQGTRIYELRAHLCVPGRTLRANFDFGFQGRRCTNAVVGSGDVERVAAFPAGVTGADLSGFKVGEGTVHWVNERGYDQTIDCGPGRPCDLVVRVQITNDTRFFTAPLCYGSKCAPEGSPTPTTVKTPDGNGGSATSTTSASGAGGNPGSGASGTPETNPDGSPVAAGADGRAGGGSGPGSVDSAAGGSASPVATVAAPWSLSRTLFVGLIGAAGGAGATVLGGRLRRRRKVATVGGAAVAVVALVLLLGACSSSDKPSTASTTTASTTTASTTGSSTGTEGPGAATITSFEVPESVDCGTAPSTQVRVSYQTSGAESAQLVVDGRVEPGDDPSATVEPLVHCDGLPHTVALSALDAAGRRTSQVKNLTTVLPGS
jgi:hypothetical protein